MSASALMWASTHNETLLNNIQAVVDALYECQLKLGTGYLSAFPSEFFDRVEAIQPVWAPYYTIHKVLLYVHIYFNNSQMFSIYWKVNGEMSSNFVTS